MDNNAVDLLPIALVDIGDDDRNRRINHPAQPWRKNKLEWQPDYRDQMFQKILQYNAENPSVSTARILLLGPIGSGKSSYFNTISSILKGRITQRAPMGSAEHSLTVKYKEYDFRKPSRTGAERGHTYTHFQLCDTMGMEIEAGIHNDDISHILEGNVPGGYQFNPTAGMADDAKGFRKNPALADKIHCVVLVVDGQVSGVIEKKMMDKLRELRSIAFKKGLPILVLLTKVDRVCQECSNDLSEIFRCETVKELVEGLADKLGLPKNSIVPVKSYESENDLETNVDILALNALLQMLNCCDDFLEEHIRRPLPQGVSDDNKDKAMHINM